MQCITGWRVRQWGVGHTLAVLGLLLVVGLGISPESQGGWVACPAQGIGIEGKQPKRKRRQDRCQRCDWRAGWDWLRRSWMVAAVRSEALLALVLLSGNKLALSLPKGDEAYFHTLFYLMMSASGVEVQTEVLTSRGRIDLLVEFPDKVFVIEFKCNQNPQAALQQIQDQGYTERYQKSDKRIFLVGLEFSTEQRNLVAWQVQAPE